MRGMNGYDGFDVAEAQTTEEREKEAVAAGLWQDVVRATNDCIEAHNLLGYVRFEQMTNPSIAEMALQLAAIEGALNGLVNNPGLSFAAWKDLSNCNQNVHWIRRLFLSLKNKDKDEYDTCIRNLKAQCPL
ncbi:hypothetical protein SAMN04487997_0184 [Frateuria terrea]|uniref:Uncharacterized protein n=2 Tax=Frateuria terrea TaxID=529704 RepID=A0A1H6ZZU4_9GAMM|nr:hypothetical protein SAMN04487997_0184 [Frateuria terrea]SFP47415.1 hypothetical protein SAMN02927913_2206 [Frateuria terrea]